MEMALVAETIANNGVMMRPFTVKQVLDSKGNPIKNIESQSNGQLISKETAATMRDLMRSVVTNGTGGAAEVSGLNVAGKTGTADHKESKNPHAWFIGFAPYDNPQIAVAVIVEEGGVGGKAAAKIAGQVMKVALKK
jgi:peptidoglycan glycosyltransferase